MSHLIKFKGVNLKTPMKNLFEIPTESLALAIDNEWKANKEKKKIDIKIMPLTALAYNAIDNPFKETKSQLISSIIEYLKFDTVRFRDVDREELFRMESRHWDPIIGWFEHRYNVHIPIDYGNITQTSELPRTTLESISRNLETLDRWPLVGVKSLTTNLKSYILASTLTERFLTPVQAVSLARLEVRFQTHKWSKVEWEHDLDEQITNSMVGAASLFFHLSHIN